MPEDEAVAGSGRPEDPGALRIAGVDSEKLELWNSRSSWRSVWPRSPCAEDLLLERGFVSARVVSSPELDGIYLVVHVYHSIVTGSS